MNQFKFFMITMFIISFFASSVLGTSISLCFGDHNMKFASEKSHDAKKSSCHDSDENTKKFQLCFECDCNANQVISNIFSQQLINFVKLDNYEFFINNNSIKKKIKDPPPKINS